MAFSGRFEAMSAPTVGNTRMAIACVTSRAAFVPATCPRFTIASAEAPRARATVPAHSPPARRRDARVTTIQGDCGPRPGPREGCQPHGRSGVSLPARAAEARSRKRDRRRSASSSRFRSDFRIGSHKHGGRIPRSGDGAHADKPTVTFAPPAEQTGSATPSPSGCPTVGRRTRHSAGAVLNSWRSPWTGAARSGASSAIRTAPCSSSARPNNRPGPRLLEVRSPSDSESVSRWSRSW